MHISKQLQTNLQISILVTALGIVFSTLSATADHMATANHQNAAMIGTYLSVFSLGCFISVPFGGMLADWKGKRRVILFAAGLLSFGLFAVSVSPNAFFMYAGLFLTGVGFGPSESMSSAFLADENPRHATRWLSISQVGFGAGAVVAPLLVIQSAARLQWTFRVTFACCAAGIFLLTAAIALRRKKSGAPELMTMFRGNVFSVLKNPRIRLLVVMIFLYLGFESVAPAYIKQYFLVMGAPESLATAMISLFWGSMILCRFLGMLMDGKEWLSIKVLCVLVMIAVALLLISGSLPVRILGVLLFGFGCGPIWPMLIALAAKAQPDRSGAACSVMMLFSTAGASMFPVLIGSMVGNIRVTFLLCAVLAGCLLLSAFRHTGSE